MEILKKFEGKIEYREKKTDALFVISIAVAVILCVLGHLHIFSNTFKTVFFAAAFVLAGYDAVICIVKSIVSGEYLHESVFVVIAGIAAFIIGKGVDSAVLMIIYQIGRALQSYLLSDSHAAIKNELITRPDTVNVRAANGDVILMKAENVKVGQLIIVNPEKQIPLDGIVKEGTSVVDISPVIGKAPMEAVGMGSKVVSGSINMTKTLVIEVTETLESSTVSRILNTVKESENAPSKAERITSKILKVLMPAVFITALIIGIALPLIFDLPMRDMVHRAVVFMIVMCPCALFASVSLAYVSGISRAAKAGLVYKRGDVLDKISKTAAVIFDKGDILVTGNFRIASAQPVDGVSVDELLILAAYAQSFAEGPVAEAVVSGADRKLDLSRVVKSREVPDEGVVIMLDTKQVIAAGSFDFIMKLKVDVPPSEDGSTKLYVAVAGSYIGQITLEDITKDSAEAAVNELRDMGIDRIAMMTRGSESSARNTAAKVSIDRVYALCTDDVRPERIEDIKKTLGKGRNLIYVGNGTKDSESLKRADVGIITDGINKKAAWESADIILTDMRISKIGDAIKIANCIKNTVTQNMLFASIIKLIVLTLAALGSGAMWLAMFADVSVSVIAILNARRAFSISVSAKK